MDRKSTQKKITCFRFLPDELLRVEQIENFHDKFEEADLKKIEAAFEEKPKMTQDDLRQTLLDVINFDPIEEAFSILFMKINSTRDGYITWADFTSFLILGFEEKRLRTEHFPLEVPIKGLPRMYKSHHRQPIIRITCCPAVLPDRSSSWLNGNYLTVSKDGCINYWSMDFNWSRTVYSKCTTLRVQPTLITDLVALPDVSVVCTSSMERDLRFYDTSAKKFELRILLASLEYAVNTMAYHCNINDEESKLILGDQGGHVRIIFINPIRRGPFKSEPGFLLRQVLWEKYIKNNAEIPRSRVLEYRNIHTDWVRQVAFYASLNCFISASNCQKMGMYMSDLCRKSVYPFKITSGVNCFDFDEAHHIIVTGSMDTIVRVWNPFVPQKPNALLTGHHMAVVAVSILSEGRLLFSISKDKCVRIWNLAEQSCIQQYISLPNNLGERCELTTYYNPKTKEIYIGSQKIAVLTIYGTLNPEETDGYTHTEEISVVLYNPLFKRIVTCGFESTIITWDPFTGTRLMVVKNAHSKLSLGDYVPVEITAATFNPGMHLLLTGARDGSLKIWNFNTGICVRNMNIEKNCKVTAVLWIELRIFVVGWNRYVTEFADANTSSNKKWDLRHMDDILCADVRVPQTLATSSHKGELIFWRLETGQPYKSFNVGNPTGRIQLQYAKNKEESQSIGSGSKSPRVVTSNKDKRSKSGATEEKRLALPSEPITLQALTAKAKKLSVTQTITDCINLRPMAVHAMLFLQNRPMRANIGTLVVAVDNGMVQIYSHHGAGGFLSSFSAIHSNRDCVIFLESDQKNEYLFTGHKLGYVKIWLIINYFSAENAEIFMPKYRIIFPFLWTDLIQCRAKRAVRDQALPLLCNSFQAHLKPVTGIVYINECQIFCSCSSDRSARLWTLGGKYLGTLGTFRSWTHLPSYGLPPDNIEYRVPPDVKRVASWTTLKVNNGGLASCTVKRKPPEVIQPLNREEQEKGVYGSKLEAPVLGHHFSLPLRKTRSYNIKLDNSLPVIPIYIHIKTEPIKQEVNRINTPRALAENKSVKRTGI
ncbi:WD repeat-containing protein on Y chromosome [Chrysoperla carnea]|uniref:WD repeat-containing protein on Y chromosome n=1 Tax=Chrysoperla carnea TaxID=189513 RepID=UPI001D097D3E|nr:WD repeat-containing protein on Y chromosome [Chrysoperla carnea]